MNLILVLSPQHSQEIADGVSKSAQAVQAAEAGIRQIGSLARQRTMCMLPPRFCPSDTKTVFFS